MRRALCLLLLLACDDGGSSEPAGDAGAGAGEELLTVTVDGRTVETTNAVQASRLALANRFELGMTAPEADGEGFVVLAIASTYLETGDCTLVRDHANVGFEGAINCHVSITVDGEDHDLAEGTVTFTTMVFENDDPADGLLRLAGQFEGTAQMSDGGGAWSGRFSYVRAGAN